MNIAWIFSPHQKSKTAPSIGDQRVSMNSRYLCLRNPWISDSIFMGKMYSATTFFLIIFQTALWKDSHLWSKEHFDTFNVITIGISMFVMTPFLWYRIFLIKRLSHIYFDYNSKAIIYKRNKKTITLDWNKCVGGFLEKSEFGGNSFSISYALAIAQRTEHGTIKPKDAMWFPSNEPSECNPLYAQELWEYIRHFMAHGHETLPAPKEPNWWHLPLHTIFLTPKQAWRHYAPWRTGEPGEMQGKKNWMLPFWFVLFPYNLFSALCWYVVCRLFNVKSPPAPI
ncbi:hypothetical protein [Pseudomonas muyukensis]|uniref:Uncharacterized protein n=1 Tax=Pseudomonas muyukensis TaxID=2842357 RepID=A0ABX8MCH4_9PSED|nr:hypothetical protein [Pseudomonas muyukensis]QXH36708.1 hypothetical protein KSS95_07780 [Pseudomonas muyukensis]